MAFSQRFPPYHKDISSERNKCNTPLRKGRDRRENSISFIFVEN